MKDLSELIGETSPEERKRLQRVHELLLEAGPPPELPPALAQAPVPSAEPRQREEYSWLPRRRSGRVLTAAVAFAAVALAIGYVIGHRGAGFQTEFSKTMHGTKASPHATAALDVGKLDAAGNWPLQLTVTGLRQLPKGGYYELWLAKHGQLAASCGTFRVEQSQTVVRLNAPYDFRRYKEWIVVAKLPGKPESTTPLLST
jgi:Anti-sigma-K factor rskA, C-terminal